MSSVRVRLFAAFLALCLGIAALIVAILLHKGALSV
jgi:hypothetical protein